MEWIEVEEGRDGDLEKEQKEGEEVVLCLKLLVVDLDLDLDRAVSIDDVEKIVYMSFLFGLNNGLVQSECLCLYTLSFIHLPSPSHRPQKMSAAPKQLTPSVTEPSKPGKGASPESPIRYHSAIGMAPYEALYGRKCRSPVCWMEVGDKHIEGPELIKETSEKVPMIRERLKTAFSRQKSYADPKRKDVHFSIGDHVFLKVSPMKGVMRFGKKGKLSPRYVGPFEVLERVGNVSYRLALPPSLGHVHPTFHVSMLRKYVPDSSHVLQPQVLEVDENLAYEETPIAIIDRQVKKLRNKEIAMVKIQWKNHGLEECIWESEQSMLLKYPHLFSV